VWPLRLDKHRASALLCPSQPSSSSTLPEKDLLEVAPYNCLIAPGATMEVLLQLDQLLHTGSTGELSADERVWIVYLVQTLTSSPAAFI